MPRGGVRGHHNYPKGRASKGKAVVPMAPGMVAPVTAPKPLVVKAKGVGRGHGAHHHGAMPKAHHPHRKKVK